VLVADASMKRPRLRPGYAVGAENQHHFVLMNAAGQPEWEAGHIVRALCGSYVDAVDEQRPLWKAGGEPCSHCSRIFRELGYNRLNYDG